MTKFHFLICPAELMQTEMHHIRTLRIMSEVYSKGLQKEVQLELQTVEKLFPALDELLELHSQLLLRLLERKRESQLERGSLEGGFIINRIGDILVSQVRGGRGWSDEDAGLKVVIPHNELHFSTLATVAVLVVLDTWRLQMFTILYKKNIKNKMCVSETHSMN